MPTIHVRKSHLLSLLDRCSIMVRTLQDLHEHCSACDFGSSWKVIIIIMAIFKVEPTPVQFVPIS